VSSTADPHGWVLEAVDLYEIPLLRYARRLLGDVDLAADAVQHAFVKLCAESQARIGHRVAPWLFHVCRNRAIDHLRRSGREHTLADDPDAARPATPIGREADPSALVERADLARRLRDLLADLPASQRESIDLWCEGLSYREIADITGRQEGHIRVLVHRGLTALRNHPAIRELMPAQT